VHGQFEFSVTAVPKTLGEIAIEAGLVNKAGAARAGRMAEEHKQPLVVVLIRELGANAIGGVNSNDWHCAPVLAQIECSAMGGRAPTHVVVARVASRF
jgi:hypothetical protein